MATADAYRADITHLTTLAEDDLATLWQQVSDAVVARELLMDVLPELVAVYGAAAATLAADWYDELREEAEAAGRFRAIPAELPDRGRTDALALWGTSYLDDQEPDLSSALVLVSGGFQRIIADAGRETVTTSTVKDPASRGWRRVGSGTSCAYCTARNGTLRLSPTFTSHDHCNCFAVPAFS